MSFLDEVDQADKEEIVSQVMQVSQTVESVSLDIVLSRCGQSAGSCLGLDTCVHYCFVLGMGCKAVGPVCFVSHVKEPSALYSVKRRGSPWCLGDATFTCKTYCPPKW